MRNRKKRKSIFPVLIIIILIILLFPKGSSGSRKEESEASKSPDFSTPAETDMAELPESSTPTEVQSNQLVSQEPVHVFYVDLAKEKSTFDGQLVETTVPVRNITPSGEITVRDRIRTEIEILTGDRSYYDNRDSIEYVTVKGIVKTDSSSIRISNPEILYAGGTAPSEYAQAIEQYEATVRAGKIAVREQFIEKAVSPSWDELSRYPDTYKEQQLKLSVYITEVESDTLFANGRVSATYNGGEICIYDNREIREPRLKTGDRIVLYCEGAGLTTIKTILSGSGILGSNVGAEVVDTRDVPAVNMIYTELDNIERFGATDTPEDDRFYQAGVDFGEKINEMIGG